MKRFGLTAIVVAFSLASLLTACQKKEAPKPQPAATEQKPMTKEDYVKGVEAKIDEFGKKAVAIEEKAKTAAGKEKDELTEKAKKVKEKLAPATEEVNKLKASTEQNWDAAKSKIEGLVGDIQKELGEAAPAPATAPAAATAAPAAAPAPAAPAKEAPAGHK